MRFVMDELGQPVLLARPLLTTGAVEALMTCASDELKAIYLEKMVTGEWTGTMNLTEPQAGSDLALIRTRAEPQADGSYKIFGQKIFITYGDHDMTDNIVHLVLARLPDAPEGVKGISLFLVPKFLVNADGSLGARNDATACRSNTSSASTPARPASWPSATTGARSATWSAKPTAASSTCSS
jgi:alkylation response protein AidB-like acyl-CoA dehydrogenase